MAVLALGLAVLLTAGAAHGTAHSNGSNQVAEGARKVGQGVEEAAKGISQAISDAALETGKRLSRARQRATPVADKLHDRARDFGRSLWDGMKSAAHAVDQFFAGTPANSAKRSNSKTPARSATRA